MSHDQDDLPEDAPARVPTLRQQQAAARREQILEIALGLFARQGFAGTSTRQIAREAGIAEGLIFHYFPTKEDLLNGILETRHSFLGELRVLLATTEAHPADEVMRRLADGWLRTLRSEAAITSVMFSEAQINPRVHAALTIAIDEGVSRLSTYLKTRIQVGELRADLPLASSAHMFFSSLMMFFLRYRTLPDAEWSLRTEAFVTELIAVWFEDARSNIEKE